MDFISVFDVIGPNMIGPSSSHTAGAVSIGLLARKLFGRGIHKVTFYLYGSFAKTYRGHGTDKALLGGILGFQTDDIRIKDAIRLAEEKGLVFKFIPQDGIETAHPNTVDIEMEDKDGYQQTVRGESIGGGKVRIVRINRIDVEFTGEYSTLIVKQSDKPGVVAYISKCLADHQVNIAFLRMFREEKGATAYTVVEADESIPADILKRLEENSNIKELTLIQGGH